MPLKPAGSLLKACCPFHNEKTPSFTVYRDTKSFYCFGCGTGGNVIDFVKLIENIDFSSAVAKLAEWARIPIPEDDGEYRQNMIKAKRVQDLTREAARYFHRNLVDPNIPESRRALEYLQKRGIKMPTIIHFGLGYASDSYESLTKYLSEKGYTKDEQFAASVCSITKKGGYSDFFRGRIMFPIIDVSGTVIAFSGRLIVENGDPRRYLNSADRAYKKTYHLYALNFAKNVIGAKKKFDYFILCEGNMDVVSMHQAGFTNAVAGCGTSFTNEQARLMTKYANKAVLAYDTDEPGKNAMQKAALLLGEVGIEVKVLNLDGAKDPDEFIQKYGKEKFENQLSKPKGYIDNKLDTILEKYNINANGITDAESRSRALEEACKELALINSNIKREMYGIKIAEKFKISSDTVLKEIKRQYSINQKKENTDMIDKELRKRNGFDDKINPDRIKYPESVIKEEIILGILMRYPEFYGDVKNITDENLFISEFNKKIFILYKNAIDSNITFDTVMITKDLTKEETSRIIEMTILNGIPQNNLKSSLENHIEALRKQNEVYEKKNIDSKKVATDEELIKRMEAIRKERLKKGDN